MLEYWYVGLFELLVIEIVFIGTYGGTKGIDYEGWKLFWGWAEYFNTDGLILDKFPTSE